MTKEDKTKYRLDGFLDKNGGRLEHFVHEFSTFANKQMCTFFCYKVFFVEIQSTVDVNMHTSDHFVFYLKRIERHSMLG